METHEKHDLRILKQQCLQNRSLYYCNNFWPQWEDHAKENILFDHYLARDLVRWYFFELDPNFVLNFNFKFLVEYLLAEDCVYCSWRAIKGRTLYWDRLFQYENLNVGEFLTM